MINYARGNDMSNSSNYQELGRQLDIPAFIDYLILELWAGNWDWPNNNWSAAKECSENGLWRFFIWDAEGTMESNGLNRVGFNQYPSWQAGGGAGLNGENTQIAWLYRALKANGNFAQLFADRLYRHFYNNGAMTQQNIQKRFLELRDELLEVIPNMDMYILNTWVPNREDIFLDACIAEGMFTFPGPTFNINGIYQQGGHISVADALSITNTEGSGTIYYTLDSTDPSEPVEGPRLVTSTTLVAQNAAKRVLVPTGPISNAWKGGAQFDNSTWALCTGNPGGVGYERSSGYEGLISLDVEEQMYDKQTSCYIRIPFTVDTNLTGFSILTLKMQYDDGFVAYLNGTEVQRTLVSGEPAWNSMADGNHEAQGFESFNISEHIDSLKQGQNILAIHGLNVSYTSSDFIISCELVAGEGSPATGGGVSPTAIRYTGPTSLNQSTHVKARTLSGNTWSALNEAVFAVGPVKENLRITEIMYNPQDTGNPDDPNTEFIELTNIGSQAINLNLVRFTNGVDFTFPGIELTPGQYVLVVKDTSAFEAKYDGNYNIAGQYTGSLNNAGERIELQDAAGQTIHNFRYGDGWYDITDGLGFSLTVKDPANTEPNSLSDKGSWRPSATIGGSPGQDDTGDVPELGSVVINEVLAHSHAGGPDWIELHNTTSYRINIGGWFLSDDDNDFRKYEIAEGTSIGPYGYVVFYEDQHFGNINDPGCNTSFALSENGETLYLHSGFAGELTGYSEQEKFGASETAVAFGRYLKSTGTYNFVAMSENTPGESNAYPKVGPIVINEIMYHPPDERDAEYVELLNISEYPVVLYDFVNNEPWRFTDDPDDPGIEFLFPSEREVTIEPGEYLLLVKDLDVFVSTYSVPVDVQVFAWGAGRLANGSEKIQLSKPGDVDGEGIRQWIRVDRVVYSDGSHHDDFSSGVDPWPVDADGGGGSLSRLEPADYGNDIINWQAAYPSPGQSP